MEGIVTKKRQGNNGHEVALKFSSRPKHLLKQNGQWCLDVAFGALVSLMFEC